MLPDNWGSARWKPFPFDACLPAPASCLSTSEPHIFKDAWSCLNQSDEIFSFFSAFTDFKDLTIPILGTSNYDTFAISLFMIFFLLSTCFNDDETSTIRLPCSTDTRLYAATRLQSTPPEPVIKRPFQAKEEFTSNLPTTCKASSSIDSTAQTNLLTLYN